MPVKHDRGQRTDDALFLDAHLSQANGTVSGLHLNETKSGKIDRRSARGSSRSKIEPSQRIHIPIFYKPLLRGYLGRQTLERVLRTSHTFRGIRSCLKHLAYFISASLSDRCTILTMNQT